MKTSTYLLAVSLLLSAPAFAGTVLTDLPAAPDPALSYVFYLHGRIIEVEGPRPTHPEFGLYDYPAVLEALASEGAVVISEQRSPDIGVDAYAEKVLSQIEQLIAGGVAPQRIAVVGFSKGGAITTFVSNKSERPEIRFALLAVCGEWLAQQPSLRLTGQVLSIHESSDSLGGSCDSLAQRPPGPASFAEIEISTGLRHGAFYQPRDEWTVPLLEWLQQGKTH